MPPTEKHDRRGVVAADGDVRAETSRARQSRAWQSGAEQRSVPATVASILAWPLGIVSGQTRHAAGQKLTNCLK